MIDRNFPLVFLTEKGGLTGERGFGKLVEAGSWSL